MGSAQPVVEFGVTTTAQAKLAEQVYSHASVPEPQPLYANDSVNIDGDLNDLFHESPTIQTGLLFCSARL